MITASLMGGLGNYMFQISTAFSLALDNNDNCMFDENDVFAPHKAISTYRGNILRNIGFSNNITSSAIHQESTFEYNHIPYSESLRLSGYFQSEKYFAHNRDDIISLFSIDHTSKDIITSKYGKLLSEPTCSIHVRRGDYLTLPNQHPVCELEYYLQSISLIGNEFKFLIFSDDIPWCKENFKGDKFIFIDGNQDYIDMWLMSLCNHNIIANSSFSWWGAWLNKNPGKIVICPHKWFGPNLKLEGYKLGSDNAKDLRPEKWIKL